MSYLRMALRGNLGLALGSAVLLAAVPASAQRREPPPSREAAQYSFAPIVKKAAPAVVNVYVRARVATFVSPFADDPLFRRFFGDRLGMPQERFQNSLGSGVIVSPDGVVVTNTHVVKIGGAAEIRIALADRREFDAKVVQLDEKSDIAVLRIEGGDGRFPYLEFENSDAVEVGDLVLAIGNPFGVGQTVTSGIVSALGRTGLGINTFENFIQTDAAINPGNSGGALIDAGGNLIGINTAIFSRSGGSMGIGFAIPVSTVKMVLDQIVKNGSVTRGWIGVEVQEITPTVAESFKLGSTRGALVAGVYRGGPADKAGVKPGDVLTEIQGKPVIDPPAMLNLVAALEPGSSAKMKLRRQGRDISASITVGRRPKPQPRSE
jgi:Do/DeqQ family serine protease